MASVEIKIIQTAGHGEVGCINNLAGILEVDYLSKNFVLLSVQHLRTRLGYEGVGSEHCHRAEFLVTLVKPLTFQFVPNIKNEESLMRDTIQLLLRCQAQFQYYAQQHLNKVPDLEEQLATAKSRVDVEAEAAERKAKQQLSDTLNKHEVNLYMAQMISDHLSKIHDQTFQPELPSYITQVTHGGRG
jgi:hypothetical protein